MLDNRKILVVIPARGGSKGVPLKNIRTLAGLPLIAHIAPLVHEMGCIDRTVVSTDDERIAEVARAHNLAVPFARPPSLGGDTIGDVPVLQHALLETERIDETRYDVVVMLQPTCPARTAAHVRHAIDTLIRGGWDAVWTVSRADPKFHPFKQLRLSESGLRYFHDEGASVTARQQLEPLYYRNGAAYALTRDCLLEQGKLLGARTTAVVIDQPLVNIDTLEDFDAAERLLHAKHRQ